MFVEELKNDKEWMKFLQTHPEGTFYHSLKWREVIQKSFSYTDHYITIKDECGSIVGICPGFINNYIFMKFFSSLPNSDYGGPIIRRASFKRASVSLRNYLQKLCTDKDLAYTSLSFTDVNLARYFESSHSYNYEADGVMEIDLKATPSDFIWKNVFSRNRRYKIKRIERDGFQVLEAKSMSDLMDFYDLYYDNMKFIDASPVQFSFVENMWKILYPENLRIWLLVKKDPIGGILVFKYGQKVYWYLAGIDRRKSRNISVMPFLVWKEIKVAEAEGYSYVSLGSTPSDPRKNNYLKKSRMGGKFRLQRTIRDPITPRGRVFIKFLNNSFPMVRNIPVALRNRLQKLHRF